MRQRLEMMDPFILMGGIIMWPIPSIFAAMFVQQQFSLNENGMAAALIGIWFTLSVLGAFVLTVPSMPWMKD